MKMLIRMGPVTRVKTKTHTINTIGKMMGVIKFDLLKLPI